MTSSSGFGRLVLAAIVVLLIGIPGRAGAEDPSEPPDSVPTPSVLVLSSPAEAALLVIASDPRFAGIGALLPAVIGQSAWYEAYEAAGGYEVIVTLGWGDCMAGCIRRHTFAYRVAPHGSFGPPLEAGDPLPVDFMPTTGSGDAEVVVRLVSAPTCPVETVPRDPACDPRPVAGATVVVRDSSSIEVARLVTGTDGRATATLVSGAYLFEPRPAAGLLGTPEPAAMWVLGPGPVELAFSYDTGIR